MPELVDGAPHYPGNDRLLSGAGRDRKIASGAPHAWRLDMARAVATADTDLTWPDAIAGPVHAKPMAQGDVVLARKDALASYHLAVTLDDAAQGVTHVMRGADLFAATDVHRLLQALLGLPTPLYHHHALLVGPDGQRLAKRNDAPTLESMRLRGKDGQALAARLRAGGAGIGIAGQSA